MSIRVSSMSIIRYGFLIITIAGLLVACGGGESDNSLSGSSACQSAQSTPQLISVSGIEASGYQIRDDGVTFPPENIIDGNATETRWASQGMPQWVILDLGTSRLISQTHLSFYNYNADRTYDYTVETSVDKVTWIDVVPDATSGASQWTVDRFMPIHARYVRVTLNSANNSNWAGMWEAKVYGLDSTVTAACPERNLTLAWQPRGGDPTGYIIHYGRTEKANKGTVDLSVGSSGFNPDAPSATLRSSTDLGLAAGDNVCFRVRAYNAGAQSSFSSPVCAGI